MLRPRPGSDFSYSKIEMEIIVNDMEVLQKFGADGFVFGALLEDRNIDIPNSKMVIEHANGLPVTFHRAFDLTSSTDLLKNCLLIENIGFKRLLTSGLNKTAIAGINNIKMIQNAMRKLIIIPGSGINVENAYQILRHTHCHEFHSTARMQNRHSAHKFVNTFEFGSIFQTNRDVVRSLVDIGTPFRQSATLRI